MQRAGFCQLIACNSSSTVQENTTLTPVDMQSGNPQNAQLDAECALYLRRSEAISNEVVHDSLALPNQYMPSHTLAHDPPTPSSTPTPAHSLIDSVSLSLTPPPLELTPPLSPLTLRHSLVPSLAHSLTTSR